MDIRITAKQMELTTALRDYVNTRFSRINKFGDMFSAAEVHLDSEKREQKVTANLKGGKKHFFSEAVDPADMYKAIDACVDKLEKQIRRGKDEHEHVSI